MKLPFDIRPKHWKLVGKEREIARANYYLIGEELDRALVDIDYQDTTDRKLKNLEIDYKYDKIEQDEYEKETASINDQPFIKVINSKLDPESGINGFQMELIWNDKMIELLKKHDYDGKTDEEIIEKYFLDIHRAAIMDSEFRFPSNDMSLDGIRLNDNFTIYQ